MISTPPSRAITACAAGPSPPRSALAGYPHTRYQTACLDTSVLPQRTAHEPPPLHPSRLFESQTPNASTATQEPRVNRTMADQNEAGPEQQKPETKPDTHINLKVKAQVLGFSRRHLLSQCARFKLSPPTCLMSLTVSAQTSRFCCAGWQRESIFYRLTCIIPDPNCPPPPPPPPSLWSGICSTLSPELFAWPALVKHTLPR